MLYQLSYAPIKRKDPKTLFLFIIEGIQRRVTAIF